MLHFRPALDKHALIETDMHSFGSLLTHNKRTPLLKTCQLWDSTYCHGIISQENNTKTNSLERKRMGEIL